jgi:hypothetical protein
MQCLNFLNSKLVFKRDIESIHHLSEKIEKKLLQANISDEDKISKFTLEELQDIHKLAELANFILLKYEDKKETYSILKRFVSIITESAESIENLDDDISELILSAEDSINKVKNMKSKISEGCDSEDLPMNESHELNSKTCSINLTKFATEINPSEYQQNISRNDTQVI